MNLLRGNVAAHATQLYINDAAGAEVQSRARMLFGVDALIEADGGVEFSLKLGMAEDIVPAERLLDHHQVVGFEAFEVRPILEAIGGIRINHQANLRELLP